MGFIAIYNTTIFNFVNIRDLQICLFSYFIIVLDKYKQIKNKFMEEKRDIKLVVVDVVIFVVICVLSVTTIFNFNKIFFKQPDNQKCSSYAMKMSPFNDKCTYNQEEIDKCANDKGEVIYKSDCSTECNFCYRDMEKERKSYDEKASWFRIILSLILSLVFAYVVIKDKLIYYSIVSGCLISLVFSTLASYTIIDKSIFPIISLVEIIVVIILYKKVFKKNL